jgi:hypothetical protein
MAQILIQKTSLLSSLVWKKTWMLLHMQNSSDCKVRTLHNTNISTAPYFCMPHCSICSTLPLTSYTLSSYSLCIFWQVSYQILRNAVLLIHAQCTVWLQIHSQETNGTVQCVEISGMVVLAKWKCKFLISHLYFVNYKAKSHTAKQASQKYNSVTVHLVAINISYFTYIYTYNATSPPPLTHSGAKCLAFHTIVIPPTSHRPQASPQ